MKAVVTRQFRIRGHVQGVGFRYATKLEAQRLGLKGWVRNCPDGTVEARAAGNDDLLAGLEQWLQQGPPGARVEQVGSTALNDTDAAELLALHSAGFEILR